MLTRAEHLAWCKTRALRELEAGDMGAAVASMLTDLGKWDGGAVYDASLIQLMSAEAMLFRKTPAQVRDWVEGFN